MESIPRSINYSKSERPHQARWGEAGPQKTARQASTTDTQNGSGRATWRQTSNDGIVDAKKKKTRGQGWEGRKEGTGRRWMPCKKRITTIFTYIRANTKARAIPNLSDLFRRPFQATSRHRAKRPKRVDFSVPDGGKLISSIPTHTCTQR